MSTWLSESSCEHLIRNLAPQVLGLLVRRCRDFAAAEDAVQDAIVAAASQWPRDGVPDHPKAWLIQVASRRLTDTSRAELARERREREAAPLRSLVPHWDLEENDAGDDTLTLLFLCCHPALTRSSAIALTLRAFGGLTTAEIASAFLVPEATLGQRISRAKQAIRSSGVGFHMPAPAAQSERLRSVLHVLYLIFNEGYTSSAGPKLQRVELAQEAIRLTRLLYASLADHPEVAGLLALLLLTDARRQARTGPCGELIPLSEQDRTLWNSSQIAEGVSLLASALGQGAVGSYQLKAAIAAVHDEAPAASATDWPQILALYELLLRVSPGPMVVLNHAIAAAMVHGPSEGLRLLEPLDREPRMADHHRLAATRAHLLEMRGDFLPAAACYRLAAARTESLPERNYLIARAARLGSDTQSGPHS